MVSRVLETISRNNMINGGEKVIVALSGGADSVVLLHVLLTLGDKLSFSVMAAHVNHNLRGDESIRDRDFVINLCKKRNVELFVKEADINALCKESGESFELCARRVRYSFFEDLCNEHGAVVATAHTLSDAAETALFNMARGTALSGLCSIPYVRGRIIRPLLDISRCEIEAYAAENSLQFVNDSTNFDPEICNRNRIRHGAIPVLKEVNSAFEHNFMKLREQLLLVDSFMKAEAQQALQKAQTPYGYRADILGSLDKGLLGYAIKLLLEKSGAGSEQKHIELISSMLDTDGAVMLSKGFTAVCKQGVLRVVEASLEDETSGEDFCVSFKENSTFNFNGKVYVFKTVNPENNVNKKFASSLLGCAKISDGTVVRTRRQGDRFTLPKRGIAKDLRKLQNELKIPAEQRDKMLLIASGSEVLWAEGIGVSASGMSPKGEAGIWIDITLSDK